jgi:NAD-dependent dihydropyrimidine dehydrogenase PreA subunit
LRCAKCVEACPRRYIKIRIGGLAKVTGPG